MPPWGVRTCVAGIPQERLNMVFAYQQESEWCWAACIQMVFGYWGHPITQQEIVSQTWGVIANMPAQPMDIIRDLNRRWTDRNGEMFTVAGDVFSANGFTAVQDLAAEMPLIIGSMGHAMVLTAVSYNQAMNSQSQLTGALVRDPWPGRGGRRPLTPTEAAATMLLARIHLE
jgi:ABC-type bacteriocin/lantibiotic exporter with double-glycine peptidase domain